MALALDALLGEPRAIWSRVPHPAVLMGRAVDLADRRLNLGAQRRMRGAIAIAALTLIALGLGLAIHALPFAGALEIIIGAILIAQRSLSDHVLAVAHGLERGLERGHETGLEAGRAEVAMIVGRDTGAMDETAVARAAIESAAENFSDGVVAPVFWFALLGLPGIIAYKMVNTADSMIAHRSEKYAAFGFATAKLDDAMNWLPARLAAGLLCLAGGRASAWGGTRTDARFHRSPNAGWPEAAAAYALGIALAGPRSYDGVKTTDPYLNAAGRRDLDARDIRGAVRLIWTAWAIGFALLALSAIALSFA